MKGKLKHVPKTQAARQQYASDKYSIKQLLLSEGYNEQEIQKMIKEDRLLIAVPDLRRGLRTRDKLYILETDEEPRDEMYTDEVDRFRDLDIE